MLKWLLDPWLLITIVSIIALYFIVRNLLLIKKIDSLRSKMLESQKNIQTQLDSLSGGEND